MKGGNPAPNKNTGNDQSTASTLNDYVAVVGLVLVGILAIVVVWYYGTGTTGETSAAGVLGLTFTAIGSIVGTVFGVSAGTKSGAAGGLAAGQQVSKATARSATAAMASTIQSVRGLKEEVARVDTTLTAHHAKLMATGTAPPQPPSLSQLQMQIDAALLKAQGALEVISAGT